jgi:hypothetical protein
MAPPRATTCKVCGGARWDRARGAFCESHFHEYQRAQFRQSQARGVPSSLPDRQRIDEYLTEAIRQGANEAESWWCAMAAEARYQREGRSSRWVTAFITAELDWLRANAKVLAKLDAHQEVA